MDYQRCLRSVLTMRISQNYLTKAKVDPGFPVGGGANPPGEGANI